MCRVYSVQGGVQGRVRAEYRVECRPKLLCAWDAFVPVQKQSSLLGLGEEGRGHPTQGVSGLQSHGALLEV